MQRRFSGFPTAGIAVPDRASRIGHQHAFVGNVLINVVLSLPPAADLRRERDGHPPMLCK